MGMLSNDLLRKKSMGEFLRAMGIDTRDLDVSSIEGLFSFSLKDARLAKEFAEQLNDAVQEDGKNQEIKSISLSQIIEKELANATCTDIANTEVHRASCLAIFQVIKTLKTKFIFSQETGLLEISLPSPAYAPIFNLMKYPHMVFTSDGKLVLDIKKFLKDVPEKVVKIDGLNPTQMPIVL